MSSSSQALPKSGDHPAHPAATPAAAVTEMANGTPAVRQPAASDPLSAIKAMSEEEKIALFS